MICKLQPFSLKLIDLNVLALQLMINWMTITTSQNHKALQSQGSDTRVHTKQVAQLWQRDSASSINDFRWGGSIWGYYGLKSYISCRCDMTQFTLMQHIVSKPFLLLGLAAEYNLDAVDGDARTTLRPTIRCLTDRPTKLTALETISSWLILKKRKNRSLSHPLGHLGVMYALQLWLIGKPVVDFIFVLIELFFAISYGWDVMSGNLLKSAFFEGGWVTLNADFRGKGASPTNHSWCQSSRVIALSCGIKISAVHHLDLSQSPRVTDGRTDRRTDRQNYDSQDRPRICSRGKNRRFLGVHPPKKHGNKTHLKPNCTVLFNSIFCYFELLKHIGRTLPNIF